MTHPADQFFSESSKNSRNKELKKNILKNISIYSENVAEAKSQFKNLDLAKERAANIKWKVLENLDKYLIEFEANFIKKGGKVIWAQTGEEAIREIAAILKRHSINRLVKTKTSVGEEINIREGLQENGITVFETDLGDFIQRTNAEGSFHFVTSAIDKTQEDINQLFSDKLELKQNATDTEIVGFSREKIRQEYVSAEAAITGLNFMLADIGAIALTENEGNILNAVGAKRMHIAITTVEKILPSLSDLELFWPLLSTYGTGQNISCYNTVLNGPRSQEEEEGPEEMFVVIIDNGRSALLEQPEQRQALACIKCGACLNVCPVYSTIGGQSYGTPLNGPIGSVATPYLKGLNHYNHLSYASSLCGKCTEVCPVNINLHKMLLYNRRDAVKEGLNSTVEKGTYYFWLKGMLKRETMNKGGNTFKNFMLSSFFKKEWGDKRELPKVNGKSFNEQWREKNQPKKD